MCCSKKVFFFKIDLATNFRKCDLATRIKRTGFSIVVFFYESIRNIFFSFFFRNIELGVLNGNVFKKWLNR